MRRWALLAAWILAFATQARADAVPPKTPPAPASQPVADRAAALFERGVRSADVGAYESALEDFRASLDLYPTPVTMKNAALCLRELGRHDEALELLEALASMFRNLSPDELRENQVKIDELSKLVGWVELRGIRPSSRVTIDDRDRKLAPAGSRLRVTSGPHHVRVFADGFVPGEASVVVIAGQTVVATIDQRAEAPPSGEGWAAGLELGGVLTTTLGGDVVGCSGCEKSVGRGGRLVARLGHSLGRSLSLSLDAGYLLVGQDIDGRDTRVIALSNLNDWGKASDALSMRGAMVGLSLAYRLPALGDSFVRAGAGTLFGWVRDERSGIFTTDSKVNPMPEEFKASQTQRQAAYYAYASLAFGVGFRLSPSFRIGAGVDATLLFALRKPRWDASCPECRFSGRDGESWFEEQTLSGSVVPLVSPFIDARYAF